MEGRGLGGKLELYYTRHDELIIEVDKGWAEEVGKDGVEDTLRGILEHQIDNWEPFKVEITLVEAEPLKVLEENEDIFE